MHKDENADRGNNTNVCFFFSTKDINELSNCAEGNIPQLCASCKRFDH